MKKRLLSALLAITMMLTMPLAALAVNTGDNLTDSAIAVPANENTPDSDDQGGETTEPSNEDKDENTDGETSGISTLDALKKALTSASDSANKTVTLTGDITIDNNALTGLSKNGAVITIPAGVTLDGANYTITASGWNDNQKNSYHILSVENATDNTTTTIKDLTIVGNENTKSGIHAYNCTGTVALDNVTIKNCGNAAVQVNGSTVTATGLITEGNAWGAVNVDKGTAVTNSASFNMTSGDLREPNKIWTELKNEDGNTNVTITVPDGWASAMPSYDGRTYYVTNDAVPVKIGDTPYATLRDAALAAANAMHTENKTITLCTDVTVTNQNIENIGNNEAIITLPDGWTLDGQNHTITAAEDWSKDKNNHILGVTAATTDGAAIKDVIIVGNENTKHGINAWTNSTEGGHAGKLTLTNVTINNCGTAGLVIQNTEVDATNLTTIGNTWGAVNVDSKGAPKLNLTNANLGENVQVWTELSEVSEGTITIDGTKFEQVKGEGSANDSIGLKGFTYYTTDPSKLGEASITKDGITTVYTTFENALSAAQTNSPAEIELLKDVEVENLISITSAGLTIDGNGKTIKYATDAAEANGTMITVQPNADNVTIKNLTVDTDAKTKHGIQFYCVEGSKLENVTVNGGTFTSVMVNGAKATLTDCTLNPAETAYANIEYGMGTNVTNQPEIVLSNVTGSPEKPLVYADKTTADKFKTETGNESYADIANKINEKLTGADVTIIVTDSNGNVDEENSVVGTKLYTITLDAGNGTVNPSTLSTNNEGKLSTLPTPTHSNSRYTFSYWALSDGTRVDEDTVFTANTTIEAQWSYSGGSSGGGGGGTSYYSITVDKSANGTVTVSPKNASKDTTVTITVDPDEGYKLDSLTVTDKNGDTVKLTNKGDGKYTFNMPAGKVTVKATFEKTSTEPESTVFTDVSTNAYYYDAIMWAVENGVTNGTSATTFSPDLACTRAQMVTFLWRAAGSPEPASTTNPFTDVSSSAYYYDAVMWAVENDVTNGTSKTTFSPDMTVTRGQTVTFLYRNAGSPAVSGSSFADVAADAFYADAVAWAVENDVTNGTSATAFSPNAACTRGQIVTFLYRGAL